MAAEGGAAPTPQSSSNPPSADPAWAHGIIVDMARRKVKCKYCNRVLSGGVWRLKQHLAGIKGEVAPYSRVYAEVRIQFCQYMKEKETSKANISRRRQEIREELSAPPRRSVDLPRGRQTIDLDDDEEEQFRRASQASRRSFTKEDYLRRIGHHLGQGSGHGSSGQGSSSGRMSTNIPEVPVDIPRDGDPRVGPLDPFLTRRREKQPSISAAFKNLKICKEKIGRATSRWFFFNSIPANAAKGPYYESMIKTIGEVGKGVESPTSYEIYNKYMDMEVEDMKAYVVRTPERGPASSRLELTSVDDHRQQRSRHYGLEMRSAIISDIYVSPQLDPPFPFVPPSQFQKPAPLFPCAGRSRLKLPHAQKSRATRPLRQPTPPQAPSRVAAPHRSSPAPDPRAATLANPPPILAHPTGSCVVRAWAITRAPFPCTVRTRIRLRDWLDAPESSQAVHLPASRAAWPSWRSSLSPRVATAPPGTTNDEHLHSAPPASQSPRRRAPKLATSRPASGRDRGALAVPVRAPRSIEDFLLRRIIGLKVVVPHQYVSTFERIWDEYGCTLMCDGWTGELDDVLLLPEFETPPAPKRQKKTVGARGRSKKHGISIADLETIEEDVDDETPESSDNVVYQTSNDSTSKTSTPSEGSDHGEDVSSVPPPTPPPDPIVFTGEEDFTHATQDQHHGSRQGREAEAQTSSQQYARKGKKVASQFQGQGQDQGRQVSEDSGYNPNFIPHRRNRLMKKKKMQEEWECQEKLRMEFETMEQTSDTSS
ncbi:hypothetical protein Taro_010554, partial [Colocasia esculenta]|nr:hypothetical protein [Colocasia esculenta]